MRIIAGEYKGRALLQPSLDITRPTTDKIRQAIFNILEHTFHLNFEELTVLDAFAGSGAMGFEALSRGAKYLMSIERSKDAYKILKINQKKLEITDHYMTTYNNDILKTPLRGKEYNLIFLDPPYKETDLYQKTMDHLLRENVIKKDTIFCIETLKEQEILLEGNILNERTYGQIKIIFLKMS